MLSFTLSLLRQRLGTGVHLGAGASAGACISQAKGRRLLEEGMVPRALGALEDERRLEGHQLS